MSVFLKEHHLCLQASKINNCLLNNFLLWNKLMFFFSLLKSGLPQNVLLFPSNLNPVFPWKDGF